MTCRILLALVVPVLAACGGNGSSAGLVPSVPIGPTPLPPPTLPTEHNVSLTPTGVGTARIGLAYSAIDGWPTKAGDDEFDGLYRTVLRFDTSGIPVDATVTQARLTIYRTGYVGQLAEVGDIVIDHVEWQPTEILDGSWGYGHSLALTQSTIQWSQYLQIGKPLSGSGDVTALVVDDVLQSRETSAFRLYSETLSIDGSEDTLLLGGIFNNEMYEAKLNVKYVVP